MRVERFWPVKLAGTGQGGAGGRGAAGAAKTRGNPRLSRSGGPGVKATGRGGMAGVSQAALKHDPFAGAAVIAVFCHVRTGPAAISSPARVTA
jgi:hypothetical protein